MTVATNNKAEEIAMNAAMVVEMRQILAEISNANERINRNMVTIATMSGAFVGAISGGILLVATGGVAAGATAIKVVGTWIGYFGGGAAAGAGMGWGVGEAVVNLNTEKRLAV